jgi:uncharacterized protein (TIGR01777 family)
MKVAVTGATGLIGSRLVGALVGRGDSVVVLSRNPDRASASLGVPAVGWDPMEGPAPASALAGVEGVVHLAGEPVAQRWTAAAKEKIRSSRVAGTTQLVAGLASLSPDDRPAVLVSSSAAGYYGNRGDEELVESAAPGPADDFLASVTVEWERAAFAAASSGPRVCVIRTGVVLDRSGGALAKMLPPFRLGVGGPVAGGRQYISWIHVDDVVGLYLAALDGGSDWGGPVNAAAPGAVTNATFSRALGRALHRPAVLPVPGFAVRALFGEMASVVTGGQRMIPGRALELGYEFQWPELDRALEAALR